MNSIVATVHLIQMDYTILESRHADVACAVDLGTRHCNGTRKLFGTELNREDLKALARYDGNAAGHQPAQHIALRGLIATPEIAVCVSLPSG
jgi:hypothetical protein